MDEPTAALSSAEAEGMWQLIRSLREAGRTIIVISHFLEEVLAVSDTVSVLRDGRVVLVDESANLEFRQPDRGDGRRRAGGQGSEPPTGAGGQPGDARGAPGLEPAPDRCLASGPGW